MGGIMRTKRLIAACEAMGLGYSFYSGETGVGLAAYLQVGASDPHLSQPSQSLNRWYADDIVQGGPRVPEEGRIRVPDDPGLGITLDRAAVAEANRRFVSEGPIETLQVEYDRGYAQLPLY
jgi:glucarate dehydratase